MQFTVKLIWVLKPNLPDNPYVGLEYRDNHVGIEPHRLNNLEQNWIDISKLALRIR